MPATLSLWRLQTSPDGRGLPQVRIDPQTKNAGPGWGWGTALLPFLDRGNMARRLSGEVPIWDKTVAEPLQTKLTVFLCPTSSGRKDPFLVQDASGDLQPGDVLAARGSPTYGDLMTAEGLKTITGYAWEIGPSNELLLPVASDNRLGAPNAGLV